MHVCVKQHEHLHKKPHPTANNDTTAIYIAVCNKNIYEQTNQTKQNVARVVVRKLKRNTLKASTYQLFLHSCLAAVCNATTTSTEQINHMLTHMVVLLLLLFMLCNIFACLLYSGSRGSRGEVGRAR